jgi:NADP-dependent 3-hydroxy acid dehydrogenase YdfG
MVDLNFNALYDVTRAVLPAMVRRKSGHIVVIGSISGRSAFVNGTCYAATKHAVMGFSESLMLELRDDNIRVSCVMPGSVATEFGGPSEKTDDSWKLTGDDIAEVVMDLLRHPRRSLPSKVEIRPARTKASS